MFASSAEAASPDVMIANVEPFVGRLESVESPTPLAGAFSSVVHDDKKIHVANDQAQIKDAPDYDADRWDDDTRTQHGDYYGPCPAATEPSW